MLDELKTWAIDVGVKKMLPSLIKTGLAMLVAYIAAHQNLLSTMGITYAPADHSIDIDLDTASAWAMIVLPAAATAVMTALQHHGTAVIKGQPQDGSHQRSTDIVDKPNDTKVF